MDLPLVQKILTAVRERKTSIENLILNGTVQDWESYKYLTGSLSMVLNIERDIKNILEKTRNEDED